MRFHNSSVERLESRTLFSAGMTVSPTTPLPTPGNPIVAPPIKTVGGVTLHETAGTPFKAALGFYSTPVLDPPLGYFATIDWGDGTTSKATLLYGKNGKKFGIFIDGTHTYAKAGTYKTTTTLVTAPINPMFTLPTTLIEKIIGSAIVTPFPANSSNGVTITEPANVAFTAVLGTFTFPAPGTNLTAIINWGDGTTSHGVIKGVGVQGLDVIIFQVSGTHTYSLIGKYPIHVTISRGVAATSAGAIIASIESTAIVGVSVT